jgi:hypothetical protein
MSDPKWFLLQGPQFLLCGTYSDHLYLLNVKGKKAVEIYLYSFFNLAARRWWVVNAPRRGRSTLGRKNRYPFYRKLDGSQGRSERVQKLSTTGIRSPDLPSRYHD